MAGENIISEIAPALNTPDSHFARMDPQALKDMSALVSDLQKSGFTLGSKTLDHSGSFSYQGGGLQTQMSPVIGQ